jgi:hypothetical protein
MGRLRWFPSQKLTFFQANKSGFSIQRREGEKKLISKQTDTDLFKDTREQTIARRDKKTTHPG